MWRTRFIKQLVETNKALNIMYQKNGFYPTLNLPKKLKTDEEIIQFSKEINNAIKFPELAFLKDNKSIQNKIKLK
jgi:hypothetical protein|tara:strand:- start:496 stop:720 length:225 start_codon:yes stop_codon:yes gene_type:complete